VFTVPAAAKLRVHNTSDFLETIPSAPFPTKLPFDATDADYDLESLFDFKEMGISKVFTIARYRHELWSGCITPS
jgi:hypothetical protein